LNFRCQYTQQKFQSICAVLTFDPQLKKILAFCVKDRYQLNHFICIKDFNAETNTSLKLNLFSFFTCVCQHHQRKTICLYVYIYVKFLLVLCNTVVSNHVNSDHVTSFSCLDVWSNLQATSGVYAINVRTSAYHSRRCGRL
jgi:hypothetical protein